MDKKFVIILASETTVSLATLPDNPKLELKESVTNILNKEKNRFYAVEVFNDQGDSVLKFQYKPE